MCVLVAVQAFAIARKAGRGFDGLMALGVATCLALPTLFGIATAVTGWATYIAPSGFPFVTPDGPSNLIWFAELGLLLGVSRQAHRGAEPRSSAHRRIGGRRWITPPESSRSLRDLASRSDFPSPVARLASTRVWRESDLAEFKRTTADPVRGQAQACQSGCPGIGGPTWPGSSPGSWKARSLARIRCASSSSARTARRCRAGLGPRPLVVVPDGQAGYEAEVAMYRFAGSRPVVGPWFVAGSRFVVVARLVAGSRIEPVRLRHHTPPLVSTDRMAHAGCRCARIAYGGWDHERSSAGRENRRIGRCGDGCAIATSVDPSGGRRRRRGGGGIAGGCSAVQCRER